MTTRLNLLPEPAFLELRANLLERMAQAGAALHAPEFAGLLDPLMREVFLHGINEADGDEGTIWIVDATGDCLVPAFNSGPRADDIVGRFQQPLGTGLISMVFASEQPFLENAVEENPDHSKMLDTRLGIATRAMIAVPFYFLSGCRGVISCVQLRPLPQVPPRHAGFGAQHLETIQRTAHLLSHLVDLQVLGSIVAWRNA